jgi:hypothetical protein
LGSAPTSHAQPGADECSRRGFTCGRASVKAVINLSYLLWQGVFDGEQVLVTIIVPVVRKPSTKKINFSQVFAGQAVGIKEVQDDIWLVSFMDYDKGYFDLETRVLEPLENPFGPKVLPM